MSYNEAMSVEQALEIKKIIDAKVNQLIRNAQDYKTALIKACSINFSEPTINTYKTREGSQEGAGC